MDGAEPESRCVAGTGSSRPSDAADQVPIYVKETGQGRTRPRCAKHDVVIGVMRDGE